MKISIKIYKASVCYLARMAVAYVGAKSDDYARLLVADTESEMTESLWLQAQAEAIAAMPGLTIAAAEPDAAEVDAILEVPAERAGKLGIDAELQLNQYFTHALAASWLAVCGRSEAERHQAKADGALRCIIVAAAPRQRPVHG